MMWVIPSAVAAKVTLSIVPSSLTRTSAVSPKYWSAIETSELLCLRKSIGTW